MSPTRSRLRQLARTARQLSRELDSPQRVWFTGSPVGPPHSPVQRPNRRMSRRGSAN